MGNALIGEAGRAGGPNLLNIYALQLGADPDATVTFVHELGHILENRTHHLGSLQMYETARTDGGYQILPPRSGVSLGMAPIGGEESDEIKETIADYFMFWVYNVLDLSRLEGRVAQIFIEGGLVLFNRNTSLGSPDRFPLVIHRDMLTYNEVVTAHRILASDTSGDLHLMYSSGIDLWALEAKRYTT